MNAILSCEALDVLILQQRIARCIGDFSIQYILNILLDLMKICSNDVHIDIICFRQIFVIRDSHFGVYQAGMEGF